MRTWPLLSTLALCACALGPKQPVATRYDFGPGIGAAAPPRAPGAVHVLASPWLDGTGISYRLAYADASRVAVYRDSRWAAPAPQLLQEHLRQRIARSPQVMADRRLQVDLEEFTHLFSSPGTSGGVIRLRAVLLEASTGRPLAQRAFEAQVEARTSDAEGGAHALTEAARRVGDQMLEWASAI